MVTVCPKGKAQPGCPAETLNSGSVSGICARQVEWLNVWTLTLDCLDLNPGPYCVNLDKLPDLSMSHYPVKWE